MPFSELVVHGVVLGLGQAGTEIQGSQSAWDLKRKKEATRRSSVLEQILFGELVS